MGLTCRLGLQKSLVVPLCIISLFFCGVFFPKMLFSCCSFSPGFYFSPEQPHQEGSKSPYSHQIQPHQECSAPLCIPVKSTLDSSGAGGGFLGGWRAIPDQSQLFCPWIRGHRWSHLGSPPAAELTNDTQAPRELNFYFFITDLRFQITPAVGSWLLGAVP